MKVLHSSDETHSPTHSALLGPVGDLDVTLFLPHRHITGVQVAASQTVPMPCDPSCSPGSAWVPDHVQGGGGTRGGVPSRGCLTGTVFGTQFSDGVGGWGQRVVGGPVLQRITPVLQVIAPACPASEGRWSGSAGLDYRSRKQVIPRRASRHNARHGSPADDTFQRKSFLPHGELQHNAGWWDAVRDGDLFLSISSSR